MEEHYVIPNETTIKDAIHKGNRIITAESFKIQRENQNDKDKAIQSIKECSIQQIQEEMDHAISQITSKTNPVIQDHHTNSTKLLNYHPPPHISSISKLQPNTIYPQYLPTEFNVHLTNLPHGQAQHHTHPFPTLPKMIHIN